MNIRTQNIGLLRRFDSYVRENIQAISQMSAPTLMSLGITSDVRAAIQGAFRDTEAVETVKAEAELHNLTEYLGVSLPDPAAS